MANGKTHDNIAIAVALATVPVTGLFAHSLPIGIVCGISALFSGWMFGPDLDHRTGSKPLQRWGPLLPLWDQYRFRLIPYHRHWLSHGPIVGTLIRVLYFNNWLLLGGLAALLLLAAGGYDANAIAAFILNGMLQQWRLLLGGLVGLEIGALAHIIADWPPDKWGKLVRKRLYRRDTSTRRKKYRYRETGRKR